MGEYPRKLSEREVREWTDWSGPYAELSSVGRFRALVAAGHPPESLELAIERAPVDPPERIRPEDYGLPGSVTPRPVTPRPVTHCGQHLVVRVRVPTLEDWLAED